MRRKTAVVLAVALLLAAGIGTLESQAGKKKKHSHVNKVSYPTDSAFLLGEDVQFALAFCPANSKIVGAGADAGVAAAFTQTIAIDPASRGAAVIYVNLSSVGDVITVRAACLKTKTGKAKARSAVQTARNSYRQEIERRTAELRSTRESRTNP